jgi:cell division protein FtsB
VFGERLRKYALIILGALLLFQIVFSEGGILSYTRLKKEVRQIDVSLGRLEAENRKIRDQIERLKQDDKYFEEFAREKLGLLRDGERLYRVDQ